MFKNKIIQNILFVLGAGALTVVLWGLYQLIGEWLFLISLAAVIILLITSSGPPKFGNKKQDKDTPNE